MIPVKLFMHGSREFHISLCLILAIMGGIVIAMLRSLALVCACLSTETPSLSSPATNPECAVAPWESSRSVMRHLGNSKVKIGTLGSLLDLGKTLLGTLRTLGRCIMVWPP